MPQSLLQSGSITPCSVSSTQTFLFRGALLLNTPVLSLLWASAPSLSHLSSLRWALVFSSFLSSAPSLSLSSLSLSTSLQAPFFSGQGSHVSIVGARRGLPGREPQRLLLPTRKAPQRKCKNLICNKADLSLKAETIFLSLCSKGCIVNFYQRGSYLRNHWKVSNMIDGRSKEHPQHDKPRRGDVRSWFGMAWLCLSSSFRGDQ